MIGPRACFTQGAMRLAFPASASCDLLTLQLHIRYAKQQDAQVPLQTAQCNGGAMRSPWIRLRTTCS